MLVRRVLDVIPPSSSPQWMGCTNLLSSTIRSTQVDQAILDEPDRVVVIRFGRDWVSECMIIDEVIFAVAEKVLIHFRSHVL